MIRCLSIRLFERWKRRGFVGRGAEIRTEDPLLPNHIRPFLVNLFESAAYKAFKIKAIAGSA